MKQMIAESLGLLALIILLALAGSLGLCGKQCQDEIHDGIRGTITAVKGE